MAATTPDQATTDEEAKAEADVREMMAQMIERGGINLGTGLSDRLCGGWT